MLKEREDILRKAVISVDLILISAAFLIAYYLRQHIHNFYALDVFPEARVIPGIIKSIESYLIVLLIVLPIWAGMLYMNGMYATMRTRSYREIIWVLSKSSFLSILIIGTMLFLFRIGPVSRVFFILFILISFTFLLLEKLIIYGFLRTIRERGYNCRNILIVGTGNRASQFIHRVEKHPEWGWKIIGAIDDEPGRGIGHVNGIEVIGSLQELPEIFRQEAIDEVVFIVPRSRLDHIEEAIYDCEIEGIAATVAVDLFDVKIAKYRHSEFEGIPLVTFETTPAKESQLLIKRILDIAISVIGLVFLMPLFLITGLFIKLTSPGPVFFKQLRVGLNGRKFVLYKFRTMFEGAEKKLTEMEILNEMGGPVFKIKKDPRVIPVGRIIRKFSVDELPQLFNVFMGHMSLVGPRPPIPKEVESYESWQRRRLSMRPGLSCLWQISGRNKLDFDEWMKLDLEYLDNWSLWLDFKILIKTIPVVVFGIGAY